MTILRTIHCNFIGCEKELKEPRVNEGFQGWGGVIGIMDDETGSDYFGLCPSHLEKVREFITTPEDK